MICLVLFIYKTPITNLWSSIRHANTSDLLLQYTITKAIPTSTSYEIIKAGFPPKPFLATTWKTSNLVFLLLCWDHLSECAQSLPHRSHTHRHLYLALTQAVLALGTVEQYPARQVDPCASMTYANAAGDVPKANASNQFSVNYKFYHNERTKDHTLWD